MSTILEICQDAASLVATQKPMNLLDGNSQQEAIFLSIAKDTLDSLRRYGNWQELTKEARFKTTPGRDVYFIPDVCPDFYALIPNTIYVLDTAEKLVGAITPAQWMKDRFFNEPNSGLKFKIQNNCIRFLTPPAGRYTIVFQYRSGAVVYETNDRCACDEKMTITKNTDIPVFDEYLVKLGIVWRWYKRNGMPYEEEFNEYEREVKVKFGSGLAARDITLSGPAFEEKGGVYVIPTIKPCQQIH